MTARRFPPPWTVEETAPCFIVRDANEPAPLAFVLLRGRARSRGDGQAQAGGLPCPVLIGRAHCHDSLSSQLSWDGPAPGTFDRW
jgi:hypothetical protein